MTTFELQRYRRELEHAIEVIDAIAPVQADLRRKLDAVIAEQEQRAKIARGGPGEASVPDSRPHDVSGLTADQASMCGSTVSDAAALDRFGGLVQRRWPAPGRGTRQKTGSSSASATLCKEI
jgi:hypothetical protein